MKRKIIILLGLLVGLTVSSAQAREVNSFIVSDGQASYTFALAETSIKLFFYSYQSSDYGDMKSRVIVYKPLGPAPLNNPVIRAEIAGKVRWLFMSDFARLDTTSPVDLPHDIMCYTATSDFSKTCNLGMGMRVKTEQGMIKQVEVAICGCCATEKRTIEAYEAKRPGQKPKKGK
ncbi:MAG: hypothetical protein ACP59X_21115 [Solidesulfovibrio sp. DCME]|uniref:hypothetical protein n=1 Tax=Solidesulfovibrio sp. DCME TaxID=3447380 RepID=UPI003D110160